MPNAALVSDISASAPHMDPRLPDRDDHSRTAERRRAALYAQYAGQDVWPSGLLTPHPLQDSANLRPSEEDEAGLRRALEARGQQDPIDITPRGVILDGATRWRLLWQLGVHEVKVRVLDMPESDQPAYIVSRAQDRRQLTREQRRGLAADLLRVEVERVTLTDRTARAVGLPVGTEVSIGLSLPEVASLVGMSPDALQRAVRTPPYIAAQGRVEPLIAVPSDAPTHIRTRPSAAHPQGRIQPRSLATLPIQPIQFPEGEQPPPPRQEVPSESARAALAAITAVANINVNTVLMSVTRTQHQRIRANVRRARRVLDALDMDIIYMTFH